MQTAGRRALRAPARERRRAESPTRFTRAIAREAIPKLGVRLADVTDLIDGGVRRLALYNISEPTPRSARLSQIIVQVTEVQVKAVAALQKQKGVIELCIRIK